MQPNIQNFIILLNFFLRQGWINQNIFNNKKESLLLYVPTNQMVHLQFCLPRNFQDLWTFIILSFSYIILVQICEKCIVSKFCEIKIWIYSLLNVDCLILIHQAGKYFESFFELFSKWIYTFGWPVYHYGLLFCNLI